MFFHQLISYNSLPHSVKQDVMGKTSSAAPASSDIKVVRKTIYNFRKLKMRHKNNYISVFILYN